MNLNETRRWCALAHSNQRYGGTTTDDGGMDGFHPYDFHLNATEKVAWKYCVGLLLLLGPRNFLGVLKACWGHDVVEDTGKKLVDLLQAGFTIYSVSLIDAVTDGNGATRHERKLEAYRKIKLVPDAVIVKLCDRIANVTHVLKTGYERKFDLYKQEMPEFESELRGIQHSGGLLSRCWNWVTRRESVVEAMWEHLNWLFTEEARLLHWNTLQCCTLPPDAWSESE